MAYPEFTKEYTVHVYETGPNGILCLYSLFDYFQDIASDHAVKLGFGRDDLLKNNSFWVLSRIYATIEQWPVWGDVIAIKTWPRGTDKLFAIRDFEVRNKEGKIVARATSSWLIIDHTTKRIKRPDENLFHLDSSQGSSGVLSRNAGKLEAAGPITQISAPFKVRVTDLDINLHTNNVRYLKWVNDSYELDFIMNNVPLSAEINYLAESQYDDSIFIRTSSDNGPHNILDHSIVRQEDDKELCRLKIEWKAVNSSE